MIFLNELDCFLLASQPFLSLLNICTMFKLGKKKFNQHEKCFIASLQTELFIVRSKSWFMYGSKSKHTNLNKVVLWETRS